MSESNIFICAMQQDNTFATTLKNRLIADGMPTFYESIDAQRSSQNVKQRQSLLAQIPVMIIVLSAELAYSDPAREEINFALDRLSRESSIAIIAVTYNSIYRDLYNIIPMEMLLFPPIDLANMDIGYAALMQTLLDIVLPMPAKFARETTGDTANPLALLSPLPRWRSEALYCLYSRLSTRTFFPLRLFWGGVETAWRFILIAHEAIAWLIIVKFFHASWLPDTDATRQEVIFIFVCAAIIFAVITPFVPYDNLNNVHIAKRRLLYGSLLAAIIGTTLISIPYFIFQPKLLLLNGWETFDPLGSPFGGTILGMLVGLLTIRNGNRSFWKKELAREIALDTMGNHLYAGFSAQRRASSGIYISYAYSNKGDPFIARRIQTDLQSMGYPAYLGEDKRNTDQETLWRTQQALERSHIVIILISSNAPNLIALREEYRLARLENKVLIPIRIDPGGEVPMEMNMQQYIDFTQRYSKQELQKGIKPYVDGLPPVLWLKQWRNETVYDIYNASPGFVRIFLGIAEGSFRALLFITIGGLWLGTFGSIVGLTGQEDNGSSALILIFFLVVFFYLIALIYCVTFVSYDNFTNQGIIARKRMYAVLVSGTVVMFGVLLAGFISYSILEGFFAFKNVDIYTSVNLLALFPASIIGGVIALLQVERKIRLFNALYQQL